MRYIFVYTMCIILVGLLGCSTIESKNIHEKDLYLHSFTCDSLGVAKTVFGRNERWFVGLVIRNESSHPIKYKANPPIMHEPGLIYPDGGISISPVDEYIMDNLRDYVLEPGAHIFEVIECFHESNAKVGKYVAKVNFLIRFDNSSYTELFHYEPKRHITFFIKGK